MWHGANKDTTWPTPSLPPGVFGKEDLYRLGEWPTALVVEVMPSSDGFVQTVKVKTVSTVTTYTRK